MSPPAREVARFALTGSVGFAADAGLLTLLVGAGLHVFHARAWSFLVAVLVTFALNRSFTFASRAGVATRRQLLGYVAIQAAGNALNLSVFAALLLAWPALASQPWMPLAVASLAAMGLTYLLSRRLFSSS